MKNASLHLCDKCELPYSINVVAATKLSYKIISLLATSDHMSNKAVVGYSLTTLTHSHQNWRAGDVKVLTVTPVTP